MYDTHLGTVDFKNAESTYESKTELETTAAAEHTPDANYVTCQSAENRPLTTIPSKHPNPNSSLQWWERREIQEALALELNRARESSRRARTLKTIMDNQKSSGRGGLAAEIERYVALTHARHMRTLERWKAFILDGTI